MLAALPGYARSRQQPVRGVAGWLRAGELKTDVSSINDKLDLLIGRMS
jgi:hypothetical protein